MKIIVDQKSSEAEVKIAIEAMIKQNRKSKALDTKQFFGKLNWGEDAMVFQKRIRNEWD
jgi:hypothetical protein